MTAPRKHLLPRLALGLTAASLLSLVPASSMAAPPREDGEERDATGGRPKTAPGIRAASPPARTSSPPARTTSPVEMSGDEAGLGDNRCKKWPANKKFTITIPREAELQQLIQWMMTISCQKFIVNDTVRARGKVTILSPEKVTLAEAYAAFYAALETMGLTVEPTGDYFKIVESKNPQNLNVPLYGDGRRAPSNDRFVTQLVRINNADVADVLGVLDKLKGENGSIETVGNLLIITDRGSIVSRMMRLVGELDAYGTGEKIFFYQLQYADANEVASILEDIFGADSAKSTQSSKKKGKSGTTSVTTSTFSKILVDERTGTLIIATSDSDYETIRKLIEQLDVRLPGGGGRIHVKKLRNADPKEVAAVLQNLASGASANKDAKKNKSATEGGASAELFSGDVKITADEATRSLVIVASAADFKNLEAVIDELDAARKMVYLEMYLLEASVTRGLTAGAGGHGAFSFDTAQGQGVGIVGSAPSPDVNSLVLSPSALQGLAGGVVGPLIPGSGQLLGLGRDIPAFGVIIQAIQTLDDVNVVAEPHAYTADNQEAQVEVGRRVPTPGALSFGTGGQGASLTPLQSINREDVTLNIKITPHVNDEKNVTLDVELEDRDILAQDPVLGVTTTKRRFKLEGILAQDDSPVVLGGLIREREIINSQQVPGLGSIPILGWLFKRKTKTKEKVNLLVIMVPHIVDSPDDVRRIHERRTRERMEFLARETSFKKRELTTNVNYRSKSGLLSTIDTEARRLEYDELKLRQAEEELSSDRITGALGEGPGRREEEELDEEAVPEEPATTE